MYIPLKDLKERARKLAKDHDMKPTKAHEIVAKSLGYRTYNKYLEEHRKRIDKIYQDVEKQKAKRYIEQLKREHFKTGDQK